MIEAAAVTLPVLNQVRLLTPARRRPQRRPLRPRQPPHSRDSPQTMGNSSSSGRGHHDETVDFGYLTPQGIYTGSGDWNHAIVTQLIVDRKLAPFYRPLEDYDESWDDDQIIAAMKEPQQPENADTESTITRVESSSLHSSSSRTHHKRPSTTARELPRHPEAAVYRGAAECPICFMVRIPILACLLPLPVTYYCLLLVLSFEYQPFSMLRPGYLHRMLRADQARRSNCDASSLRARFVSLLCSRELRRRVHASNVAGRHR